MSRFKIINPSCRCGWKFAGFHICVDLTKPCPEEGLLSLSPAERRSDSVKFASGMVEDGCITEKAWDAIDKVQSRRATRDRDRDEKILLMYGEGKIGLRRLAEDLDLGYDLVRRVVHNASEAGVLTIRVRGLNLVGA